MKKIIFFIILAVTVCVSNPAYAWKVTIENSIPNTSDNRFYESMTCDVYGEHFFWRDKVDCTISDVGKGSSKSCDAGPGICPVALACTFKYSTGKVSSTGYKYIGVRCWDAKLKIMIDPPSISYYLDGIQW
jgi:hypothetical protein